MKLIKKIDVALSDKLDSIMLARAKVEFENGITIKNFRICRSRYEDKSLWIQEPSHPNPRKYGNWVSDVWFRNDIWKIVEDAVIAEYQKIADQKDKEITQSEVDRLLNNN